MTHEMIFAGFGGQGVLLLGQLLAYAGMIDNKQVSWIPSYGPEMRGGTANCAVIISEDKIGSPLVFEPTAALILNNPSLEKFEPLLAPNGVLVINSSIVTAKPKRSDIKVVCVPATDLVAQLGVEKSMNIIMLGAFVQATGIVSEATMLQAFEKRFAARPHTIANNIKAFQLGASLG